MKTLCAILLLSLLPMAHHVPPSAKPLVLTNVTVIDCTGAQPKPEQTVVIQGDRIMQSGKTGTVKIPRDAQVVNVTGKYLIPGLWDMHVHMAGYGSAKVDELFPLFIANGVLGIRDMGGLLLERSHEWNRQIEQGTLLGLRIVAAGLMVDGPQPTWPLISIPVTSETEARKTVQSLKAQPE